jgi:hypothetical protein
MASSFAYYGDREIEAILSDTDPSSFTFTNEARWRDKSLSAGQIRTARLNFIHSIGSCSFEEPVQDLKLFGFLA